jgi:ABC-type multidrug transport system fused ATPase/permease subunit
MWGSTGFAYNVEMIREHLSEAPVGSGEMIFDPEVVARLAQCCVSFLDSPTEVIPMALVYLGRDANSIDSGDLRAVETLLRSVRPLIKYFSSTRMLMDLPNQEVCVAMSWSGDYARARANAAEAGIDVDLAYTVPSEGSVSWFDFLVIPADAPHPDNAHRFIDFLLRPEVIAGSGHLSAAGGDRAPPFDAQPGTQAGAPAHPRLGPVQGRDVARAAVTDSAPERDDLSETPWLDPEAEPFVRLEGLSKRFGDFAAVDRVDLSIFKGELFSILGASGCGKTTRLRMLAGLEELSAGTIRIDGVDVTDLPPYERPVNIMFQSYALFPHMTVEQNVAYGLKKEGVPARQIRERVAEILELVQLQTFARAMPRQISGASPSASRSRGR